MPRNKSWFKMAKKDDIAEIEIFDEIDPFWGIGPKEFKAKFDEVKDSKSIKLLLNSPGGSVFDGMAIYNILSTVRDKLEIEVVGLAASIASIIALAGSKLTMAEGSYFMIHNPLTIMIGGAEELRKTADLLDKMKGEFVSIYGNKSGLGGDEIGQMMDDETWLTASEAIDKGFADASENYGQIAAKVDSNIAKHFAKVPDGIKRLESKDGITNPRDLESLLRDAGCSKREAVAIVADGWKGVGRSDSEPARGDPVEPNIEEATETAEQRKAKMAALCALAGI
jgi:ATP-dependent Clp endopeptidase proteolytic subunit ClpP